MTSRTRNRIGLSTVIIAVGTLMMLTGLLMIQTSPATASSQTPNTLNRPQDPVIVSGASLPAALVGQNTTDLRFYTYDEVSMSWTAIPYQIDDITSGGVYTVTTGDDDGAGIVDITDELVFMADDTGDQLETASSCKALNLPCYDENSPDFSLYEFEVTDPIDGTTGWVYAVPNTACPVSTDDYITWDATAQVANGMYNAESFNSSFGGAEATPFIGLSDLSPNGGPDLLDRQKLRLQGTVLIFALDEDEESAAALLNNGIIDVPIDGPVRLVSGGAGQALNVAVYGSRLDIGIELDPAVLGGGFNVALDLTRASFDFNPPAVTGVANWCDSSGNAYDIDGTADATPPLFDWFSVYGGASGGLFVGAPVVNPGTGTAAAYYHDSAPSANPVPDGTPDTGDGDSYSDTGVQINSSGGSVIGFNLASYILPAGTSSCMGAQYDAWLSNDLTTTNGTVDVSPSSCPLAIDLASTNTDVPQIAPAILLMTGMMVMVSGLAISRIRKS